MTISNEIKQEILAELGELSNYRGSCPVCGSENTFTATRLDGLVVYHCYSASCSVRGAIRVKGVSSLREVVKTNPKQLKLDTAPGSYYKLLTSHNGVMRYGRIDDRHVNTSTIITLNLILPTTLPRFPWLRSMYRGYIFYAPATDNDAARLVSPVLGLTESGVLAISNFIGKCINSSDVSSNVTKSKIYDRRMPVWPTLNMPSLGDTPPVICIVEDAISAVRLRNAGIITIALHGTHIEYDKLLKVISYICHHKNIDNPFIVFSLDKDAILKNLEYVRVFNTMGYNAHTASIENDIKDMDSVEFEWYIDSLRGIDNG